MNEWKRRRKLARGNGREKRENSEGTRPAQHQTQTNVAIVYIIDAFTMDVSRHTVKDIYHVYDKQSEMRCIDRSSSEV